MRRTLILIIIVILTISIWAQTEMEENTAQDTLNIETVVIDTLKEKIDPRLLLVEMNTFLDEKREIEDQLFLPHLIYKENFHLSSPFNLNVRIRKNGFSEIPFATGNLQTVQNNRNIFRTIYKRGNIFYNSYGYSLPVAITETYMGLGDKDMNNISVSLMKGSILGIPKLDMQLDYLGEKGIWQGYENEVIQNFHLHLSYDLDFARIHFDNSMIDQTLPGEKDINNYAYSTESAFNKENEYSITVENKIIDLGLKYKYNDYKIEDKFRKERDLIQVLAQKKIQIPNHQLDLSYEFVSEDITINNYSNPDTTLITNDDNSFHILSGNHESNILGFNIGNTCYFQDENNFQFDSEVIKQIFHGFSFFGEYSTLSDEYFPNYLPTFLQHQTKSRIGGGILINPYQLRSKITMGQQTIEEFIGEYFEVQNTLNMKISKNVGIKIEQWLKNERTTILIHDDNNYNLHSYPEWQMLDLLEITYFLKYNNSIKLGVKHIYHSNYSYTLDDLEVIFRNDTQNFDAYLTIQLTDKFEISVDAINLTNNKIMFTNSKHPGTHFNVNVHWIFVN